MLQGPFGLYLAAPSAYGFVITRRSFITLASERSHARLPRLESEVLDATRTGTSKRRCRWRVEVFVAAWEGPIYVSSR